MRNKKEIKMNRHLKMFLKSAGICFCALVIMCAFMYGLDKLLDFVSRCCDDNKVITGGVMAILFCIIWGIIGVIFNWKLEE